MSHDERCHVFRDVTSGVRLDEEFEVAGLVVAGDGCIGADDLFVGPVGLWEGRCDRDVLTDWEAENGSGRRELESVAVKISRLSLLGRMY